MNIIGIAVFLAIGPVLWASELGIDSGTVTCCDKTFDRQSVIQFAKPLVNRKERQFRSLRIVAPKDSERFGIVQMSEESLSYCAETAVKLRRIASHAYLLVTPLGAAVHFWDSRRQVYTHDTIYGIDIYVSSENEGQLAYVDSYRLRSGGVIPSLRVVTGRDLSEAVALAETKKLMQLMSVERAVSLVRTDSYYWPDHCDPFSLPIQWRNDDSGHRVSPSAETMFCKIGINGIREYCMLVRAR
jgi:hypothetical protein